MEAWVGRDRAAAARLVIESQKVLNVSICLYALFSVLTFSQYLFGPYTVLQSQISTLAQDETDMSYKNLTAYPDLEIYTYPNVWAAGKYITTHVSRLLLAQITARCIAWTCHPADPFHTEGYRKVQAIGREQVKEIISSTPYLTGWAGDSTTTPYFPCGTAEMPKGLASVTCMWPLLAAGMSRFADRSHRAFVKGRLTHIGEMMGIRQAEVFSKVRAATRVALAS
ncbi:hypothetical protein ACHAPP_004044 [Verticillium nonalfalfae]